MAKPKTPLSQISYGLYVIGSRGREGDHAMTANWLTQVSFEPEIVAIAIEKESLTRQLIEDGKVFAVSILKSGQKEVAGRFAKADKSGMRREELMPKLTGAPVLRDAMAYLDCRVVDHHEIGDHVVFFGEVADSGLLDEKAEPLTLHETGWRYGG
jgi:flavin reductase (DIM6/NTAB) family NADH-FMN oxidoreductase RutF